MDGMGHRLRKEAEKARNEYKTMISPVRRLWLYNVIFFIFL
jgi:hypothetical protein